MTSPEVIETLALVVAAGLAAELLATALRLPPMVVLLGAGAALGPHVLGVLELPLESVAIQLLLTLGVSFILFHGGLELSLRLLRRVALGLGLLAVPGTVLTAAITGVVAAAAFGIPLEAGLLLGAVLAPLDPAILIPLFERIRLRPKVAQTVVAESALNDAVGAVLALALAAFVVGDGGSLADPFFHFVVDLVISTGLGVAFGLALALAVSNRRLGIWQEAPVLAVLLVVSLGYVAIESAGGSGYLGAFIAGIIVGNMDVLGLGMHSTREREVRSFASVASDVVVILVFVTLGANLPFDAVAEQAWPALLTLAVLILVARPLTVLACLLPDRRGRWEPAELAFLAWTRETGVVPAALVGVLVAEGVPYEDELIAVVALAVVVTLVLQSSTKPWLARRLGLDEGEPVLEEPGSGIA